MKKECLALKEMCFVSNLRLVYLLLNKKNETILSVIF